MTTPTCINLRETFGDRFRVRFEESYYAQYGRHARVDDPWLQLIPCDFGHISPWGGSKLAACTTGRGAIAKRLVKLACTTVVQDGVDGVNVTFDMVDFDQVAAVMRPKRVRHLSPEAKARLAQAGAATRFKHGIRSDSEEQGCESRVGVV